MNRGANIINSWIIQRQYYDKLFNDNNKANLIIKIVLTTLLILNNNNEIMNIFNECCWNLKYTYIN